MTGLGMFAPIAYAFAVLILLSLGALFGSALTASAARRSCETCRDAYLCDLEPTPDHVVYGPEETLDTTGAHV